MAAHEAYNERLGPLVDYAGVACLTADLVGQPLLPLGFSVDAQPVR